MAKIPVSYQPNKIKKPGYGDWTDGGKFCTTTNPAGSDTPPASGLNLLDAFDVDWSAYKIDGLTASATSIINKLNTPATAINNFLGVLEDLDELLDSQDRSTKEGSYWIVGADIDIIIGEKTYKSLHAGDLVIINVGAHDEEIEDASGFELCYYCVLINMSGYLPLIGGTMQGSINFLNEYTKIYSESDSLKLCSPYCVEILASELHVFDILPHNADSWNLGLPYMAFNNVYSNKFIKPGSDNNFVLLAGGGTKALSEIMPDGYKMARWDEAVSWGDHANAGYVKSSGITTLYVKTGLLGRRENGEEVNAITSSIGTISLKTASENEIGGISIGYKKQSGNLYPIELNNAGQAYVTVPWTDTDTNTAHSHKAGEGLICTGTGGVTGEVTYTLKAAATDTLGGIKLGYSTNGKNYPVNVNTAGQAFVYVPWTDTKPTVNDGKLTMKIAGTVGATHSANASANSEFNVPEASASAYGVIKVSSKNTSAVTVNSESTTAGRYYPVELNSDGKAIVNVPWLSLDGYLTSTEAAKTYVKKTGDTMAGALHAPAFYETSDIRKKEIKSDLSLDKCYDLIDKCQTVIYSLKDQTKELVGMIAQEIEEFFPEVVATDEEGFKSLAYDRLVVICFKVLKDVIKRLEKLETK